MSGRKLKILELAGGRRRNGGGGAIFLLTRTSFYHKLNYMKDYSATPIASFGRRAASYWYVDGLPEILFGLMLVVMAALAFLWRRYTAKPWREFDWIIVCVGFTLYFLMERDVLDFLKSHVTYPRTGYVQPPEERDWSYRTLTTLSLRPDPPAKENVTYFRLRTVGPIWLLFFVFMTYGSPPAGWLVALVMPALAATLYLVNRRSERPYRWWSAFILALTGPVFLWVDVPAPLQRALPFLLSGGWLLAQGVCRLVNYLRTNPYPGTAEGVRA